MTAIAWSMRPLFAIFSEEKAHVYDKAISHSLSTEDILPRSKHLASARGSSDPPCELSDKETQQRKFLPLILAGGYKFNAVPVSIEVPNCSADIHERVGEWRSKLHAQLLSQHKLSVGLYRKAAFV